MTVGHGVEVGRGLIAAAFAAVVVAVGGMVDPRVAAVSGDLLSQLGVATTSLWDDHGVDGPALGECMTSVKDSASGCVPKAGLDVPGV